VIGDVLHSIIELIKDLPVGETDQSFSETVPAVHGAFVGEKDKSGLRVFVLKAGQLRILLLPAGIIGTSRVELPNGWNRHPPDRVIRVIRIDQGKVVGGDAHGMPQDDPAQLLALERGQMNELPELIKRPEVLFQ